MIMMMMMPRQDVPTRVAAPQRKDGVDRPHGAAVHGGARVFEPLTSFACLVCPELVSPHTRSARYVHANPENFVSSAVEAKALLWLTCPNRFFSFFRTRYGDGHQIACLADDVRPGMTTHRELDPTNMLSLVASLTPFSDYNQSPRNMYQV